ncbi:hypothetical protein RvY_18680 [Ramazzottius varieornatus]|uniref:Uncharacterized protein n=1 Tax=Ramazzottius varieornatus TaxID=947166 RepID=A0A1D1W6N3_RAMVA|nr:hypothetical protein RvY_18680 [Ramazzottius varieornatus]
MRSAMGISDGKLMQLYSAIVRSLRAIPRAFEPKIKCAYQGTLHTFQQRPIPHDEDGLEKNVDEYFDDVL